MAENNEIDKIISGDAKKLNLKALLLLWKEYHDDKLEVEKKLDETRLKILALMDTEKMDVDNFHLVKIKNWGGNSDRYKNKEKGIFTWMLQIRDKSERGDTQNT